MCRNLVQVDISNSTIVFLVKLRKVLVSNCKYQSIDLKIQDKEFRWNHSFLKY